jgi:adenosylcobyric acid synthase
MGNYVDSRPKAPCLAVLGTGSDVGKSVIAAALCRIFADRGLRVAPYKSQNMSNNSGVTPEGLEMGRAQIVQAEAAGIVPHVDMNPILLKPTSDVGSQVVLLGASIGNQTAMDYHQKKARLLQTANDALDRLRSKYDLVVMEGAGSCAEVNLIAHDIVNLPMAEYADAPVILVGDIHRGGIFAQLVGTLDCLPQHFKRRVAGFHHQSLQGRPAALRGRGSSGSKSEPGCRYSACFPGMITSVSTPKIRWSSNVPKAVTREHGWTDPRWR